VKDLDDYQKAIEAGVIYPEWIEGIETAKMEVLEKLDKLEYPFDNAWLNWRPDSAWTTPYLPKNWDEINY